MMQQGSKWVSAWGNAVSVAENRPERYARNITIRYPIRMPFGGSALRLTQQFPAADTGIIIVAQDEHGFGKHIVRGLNNDRTAHVPAQHRAALRVRSRIRRTEKRPYAAQHSAQALTKPRAHARSSTRTVTTVMSSLTP